MKKIGKKTYRGIDFVQLNTLPNAQTASLKQSLDERTLIKILKNDVVLDDCVLYSAYEKWFDDYSVEIVRPVAKHVESTFSETAPVV